jgi:hypothetical protein
MKIKDCIKDIKILVVVFLAACAGLCVLSAYYNRTNRRLVTELQAEEIAQTALNNYAEWHHIDPKNFKLVSHFTDEKTNRLFSYKTCIVSHIHEVSIEVDPYGCQSTGIMMDDK